MENSNDNIFEKTAKDFLACVNLKKDRLALAVIENLSKFLSSLFSIYLVTLLLLIASLFLSGALMLVLAKLLDSYIYSMLIMGVIFSLAAIIVFAKKETLIVNPIIRKLCKMMVDINKKQSDYEQ